MAPLQSEQRKGEMGEHDVGVDRLLVYSQKDGRVRMHMGGRGGRWERASLACGLSRMARGRGLTGMVSDASLACMIVAAVISFGVPIGALVVARRRLHVQFRMILVGALVFIVFAGLLEQLVHALAFAAFPGLRSTPVAFVLYGAFAAGVFEELGRSCGFMLLLRSGKVDHDLPCAIGYGIGHGGIEAMMIVGLSMISNIVLALALNNAGGADALLATVPDASRAQAAQQISALIGIAPTVYLIAGFERIVSMALHVALSVLVWMAVSGRIGKAWIFGAVLLHALADGGAALYQQGMMLLPVSELWALIATVATALLVIRLYAGHGCHSDATA